MTGGGGATCAWAGWMKAIAAAAAAPIPVKLPMALVGTTRAGVSLLHEFEMSNGFFDMADCLPKQSLSLVA